jgi:hypothetical protein
MRTNSHLAEISRREDREFTAGNRGLPIAQVFIAKLKASFSFVWMEEKREAE